MSEDGTPRMAACVEEQRGLGADVLQADLALPGRGGLPVEDLGGKERVDQGVAGLAELRVDVEEVVQVVVETPVRRDVGEGRHGAGTETDAGGVGFGSGVVDLGADTAQVLHRLAPCFVRVVAEGLVHLRDMHVGVNEVDLLEVAHAPVGEVDDSLRGEIAVTG